MKKYINGKLYEMTEEDIAKSKARSNKHRRPQANTSDYENRIKELESALATLLAKSKEAEQ